MEIIIFRLEQRLAAERKRDRQRGILYHSWRKVRTLIEGLEAATNLEKQHRRWGDTWKRDNKHDMRVDGPFLLTVQLPGAVFIGLGRLSR